MTSDTTSNHPFRIGRILKLSWELVIQNILLWLCLGVGFYFLYLFLTEKIEELFTSLMMSELELSKPLWAEGLEFIKRHMNEMLAGVTQEYKQFVSHLYQELFQGLKFVNNVVHSVVVGLISIPILQIAYYKIWSRKSRISSVEIIKRLWETNIDQSHELAFAVIRTFKISILLPGLSAVYLMMLKLFHSTYTHLKAIQINPWLQFLLFCWFNLFFIIWVFGLILFVSRWSLAPALIIIEKTKVFESLKRSWRMTALYWKKLFGLFTLLLLVSFLIPSMISDLVPLAETEIDKLSITNHAFTSAAIFPVCYYELQTTVDGDKPVPLLAASELGPNNPKADIPV